jgi:hypothetical protein
MASVAYQPDRTQTPYHGGWGRNERTGSLQIDSFFVGDDDLLLLERQHLVHDLDAQQAVDVDGLADRTAFQQHYAQWLQDSLFDSFPEAMRAHESYQSIVALGDRIVPLIASELRKEPSFLFLALEDITGEQPVPESAQGHLAQTVAAWLSWLRK